jgi:hypothetical protein
MTSALNRRSIDGAEGLVAEALELQELGCFEDLQTRILEVHTDAGKHVISVGPQIVYAPFARSQILKSEANLTLSVCLGHHIT